MAPTGTSEERRKKGFEMICASEENENAVWMKPDEMLEKRGRCGTHGAKMGRIERTRLLKIAIEEEIDLVGTEGRVTHPNGLRSERDTERGRGRCRRCGKRGNNGARR
jgi:hypothetical protein